MRALKPDLVVEEFAPPWSSMGVGHWTKVPTVGSVQGYFAREKAAQYYVPPSVLTAIERWGTRSHRDLIAVSPEIAAKLRLAAPDANVHTIGNGIDEAGLAEALRVPVETEPGLVVFIGRLEIDQKGLGLLLDACLARDRGTRARGRRWASNAQRFTATAPAGGDSPTACSCSAVSMCRQNSPGCSLGAHRWPVVPVVLGDQGFRHHGASRRWRPACRCSPRHPRVRARPSATVRRRWSSRLDVAAYAIGTAGTPRLSRHALCADGAPRLASSRPRAGGRRLASARGSGAPRARVAPGPLRSILDAGPVEIGALAGTQLDLLLGRSRAAGVALAACDGLHLATHLHIEPNNHLFGDRGNSAVDRGTGCVRSALSCRSTCIRPASSCCWAVSSTSACHGLHRLDRISILRLVPAIIGSLTCRILSAARAGGRRARPLGIVAGALRTVLHPFVMRFDGLTGGSLRPRRSSGLPRGAPIFPACARGGVRGCSSPWVVDDARHWRGTGFSSTATQDMAAKDDALATAADRRVSCPFKGLRRRALTAVAVACLLYLAYLLIVLGDGQPRSALRRQGLRPAAAARPQAETGFNRPGGITLVETLKSDPPYFGASDAPCGIGMLRALVCVPVIRRGTARSE